MLNGIDLLQDSKIRLIKTFFDNLTARRQELSHSVVHPVLKPLISKDHLINVYDTFFKNRAYFEKLFLSSSTSEFSYRLPRKRIGNTFRTVEVVQDLNGEFVLVLQTKRKLENGLKDYRIKVFRGRIKTVKTCWRIDLPIPEKWVGAVILDPHIKSAISDFQITRSLARLSAQNTIIEHPILPWLKGDEYRNSNNIKAITLFAPQAICTLRELIDQHWDSLSESDIRDIANGLLNAIHFLHSHKRVHHDFHLENIVVFKKNDQYFIKLIDLEHASMWGEINAKAPCGYDSPEIRLTYRTDGDQHDFLQQNKNSYGNYVYEFLAKEIPIASQLVNAKEYRAAHPSNDIWALGIVLYCLFTGIDHEAILPEQVEQYDNPFIKALFNRAKSKTVNH